MYRSGRLGTIITLETRKPGLGTSTPGQIHPMIDRSSPTESDISQLRGVESDAPECRTRLSRDTRAEVFRRCIGCRRNLRIENGRRNHSGTGGRRSRPTGQAAEERAGGLQEQLRVADLGGGRDARKRIAGRSMCPPGYLPTGGSDGPGEPILPSAAAPPSAATAAAADLKAVAERRRDTPTNLRASDKPRSTGGSCAPTVSSNAGPRRRRLQFCPAVHQAMNRRRTGPVCERASDAISICDALGRTSKGTGQKDRREARNNRYQVPHKSLGR
jgi:hypothetical protein